MIKEFNIIVAGVGGQGNLLISEILATAAVASSIVLNATRATF
jgi:Pyruvate/2-oxoacid:ferredoxin oxidoreductase gamma subunit